MIFGNIFTKKDKEEKNTQDGGVEEQSTITKDKNSTSDSEARFTKQSQKKTKEHKGNAIRFTRKPKNKKISHVRKAYHKGMNKKSITSAKDLIAIYDVLKKPIITEKAAIFSEKGVYIFSVQRSANKFEVADAIEARYQVRPEKIRMAKIAKKSKRVRIPGKERTFGTTSKGKKAYVYLKKGDTIKLT